MLRHGGHSECGEFDAVAYSDPHGHIDSHGHSDPRGNTDPQRYASNSHAQ